VAGDHKFQLAGYWLAPVDDRGDVGAVLENDDVALAFGGCEQFTGVLSVVTPSRDLEVIFQAEDPERRSVWANDSNLTIKHLIPLTCKSIRNGCVIVPPIVIAEYGKYTVSSLQPGKAGRDLFRTHLKRPLPGSVAATSLGDEIAKQDDQVRLLSVRHRDNSPKLILIDSVRSAMKVGDRNDL